MVSEVNRRIDEYLVVCARLGDRSAFERLAFRWQKKLLVHAWRLLRDEEAARDCVQDAWAEIVRGIARLQDERAFAAWAFRIVSRRCARHIGRAQRSRRVQEAVLDEPVMEPGEGEPPEHDLDLMRRCMRTLPPEQQATLALFYLEEMSISEVAVALDVPLGTVKTRLMHARRKLRSAILGEEA
jgi:RNA polymerase sigma-70 factor (ECF subfamily)